MNFIKQSNLHDAGSHLAIIHVAIIMDGNGRWATGRGLPRIAGHAAGAEALRRVVESAPACGIGALTVYAFSSDNWKRPEPEVEALLNLLASYLTSETPHCLESGVRMRVIGRRDRLPDSLRAAIVRAEHATQYCSRLELRLAVDYSGRDAILTASRRAAGRDVTRERFGELLDESRPVDILIRTGGEQRLSDFLLWECAYAELIFTEVMWPDFAPSDLRRAVAQYGRRERRFGGVPRAPSSVHEQWLR